MLCSIKALTAGDRLGATSVPVLSALPVSRLPRLALFRKSADRRRPAWRDLGSGAVLPLFQESLSARAALRAVRMEETMPQRMPPIGNTTQPGCQRFQTNPISR